MQNNKKIIFIKVADTFSFKKKTLVTKTNPTCFHLRYFNSFTIPWSVQLCGWSQHICSEEGTLIAVMLSSWFPAMQQLYGTWVLTNYTCTLSSSCAGKLHTWDLPSVAWSQSSDSAEAFSILFSDVSCQSYSMLPDSIDWPSIFTS